MIPTARRGPNAPPSQAIHVPMLNHVEQQR